MFRRRPLSDAHFVRLGFVAVLGLFVLAGAILSARPAPVQAMTLTGSDCFTFTFTLSGAEEVPPNGSPATGSGVITMNTTTNELAFNISFSGLSGSETGAHIHGFAPPGSNAGILYGLPSGSPKIGSLTYTEAQEANLLAGLSYVNIHSSAFPGGEIRGQVDDAVPCAPPTPTATATFTPTPTPTPCNPTAVNVTYNPLSVAYSTGDSAKFFRVFLYNPATAQSFTLFQANLPACFTNTINSAFNVPPNLFACAFLYDPVTQNLTLDCSPN